MTILVPYDGSPHSEDALKLAATSFADDSILLLHVIEPFANHTEAGGYTTQRYNQEVNNAEMMLEDAASLLSDELSVETDVRYGRPAHKIVDVASEANVDQIVLGSHGREGAKRLLLGSVAEAVVRRAPVPVTVIRQSTGADSGTPEELLVPFDGSDQAKHALSYAFEQYPDAEITVIYAVYPPPDVRDSEPETLPEELEDWAQHLDDHTKGILELAKKYANDRGRTVKTDTVTGDPSRGIVEYAEEHDPDHIVMGSHGRDGLKRLLLGSVAETVVRRAPTSVTVVR